ncbi:MAG: 1-acyl-sn-glycerol-3-phosphate acyltransferase [Xanthomonadales bacterium]|nr:1-acyl-sn-glycerol-3-phosphate acyltransferase [Gammaproteobacteria bacterium]MBT8050345.1 1-acyl-sn-glycerol-3-phosphate acyltransferase [Gammaproteobacteria bacterium]NNJ80009.1 1-acyl-sn-glycerol-3-phosphate acyltransferase [Xanthomonadales bacterium]NNL05879.1 1-acyl-sn-glycerol-3-phosphate acyltransferase [Xanthomonadales bacterium]
MKKILYWPYQLYVWLVLIPLAALISLVCSTGAIVSAYLVSPHFASRVFGTTWARLIAWSTPVVVDVQGAENAERDRSYIVVSNHQSMYDIFVVYGWLSLDLKWVMKKELRKVPGIGLGCEKVGHIFVDRRNHAQASQAINDALQRLGDGIGILFFPEGTRSPDGHLLPFKKGAFHTAIEQQIPLLPVSVSGTRDIMPAGSMRIFPGKARLSVHPAIETAGMTHDDLPELLRRSREAIASGLPAMSC